MSNLKLPQNGGSIHAIFIYFQTHACVAGPKSCYVWLTTATATGSTALRLPHVHCSKCDWTSGTGGSLLSTRDLVREDLLLSTMWYYCLGFPNLSNIFFSFIYIYIYDICLPLLLPHFFVIAMRTHKWMSKYWYAYMYIAHTLKYVQCREDHLLKGGLWAMGMPWLLSLEMI